MANVYIKSKKISYTKKTIKGTVKLSDRSTTKFEVVIGGEWSQWGNSTDNLSLTVPLMEKLQQGGIYD
jgi:hypothetical protein